MILGVRYVATFAVVSRTELTLTPEYATYYKESYIARYVYDTRIQYCILSSLYAAFMRLTLRLVCTVLNRTTYINHE